MKKQLELLKKYNVTNYTIENEKITINGSLDLGSLTSIPDSQFLSNTTINGSLDLRSLTSIPDSLFLSNTTINGSLYLESLTSIPDSQFLSNTTINGYLYLESLTSIPDSQFLSNTTINGSLDLRSLTSIPDSQFLSNTTINGSLDLRSLTSRDKDLCRKNVQQLNEGYNEKLKYCFFDGILSKVESVHKRKEYTIYKTKFGFISQKDKFTAHGKTIKIAIQDLEFKIISEKLKNEPIYAETELTINHYRLITGACIQGTIDWLNRNGIEFKMVNDKPIEVKPILAKDLLPLLEKSKAYGLDKFKSLIKF